MGDYSVIPARYKKLVVTGLVVVFFGLGAFVLYQISRPKLTISFDESFNPLTTTVMLNNTLLLPSGKDGRIYKTTTTAGNHTLRVSGPTVTPISEEISLSAFTSKTIDQKLTPISPEEIARKTLNQSKIIVTNGTFYEDIWLVAEASNFPVANKDGYTAWPVFLHFNATNSAWEDVNAVGAQLYETAPFAARRDYEALADD